MSIFRCKINIRFQNTEKTQLSHVYGKLGVYLGCIKMQGKRTCYRNLSHPGECRVKWRRGMVFITLNCQYDISKLRKSKTRLTFKILLDELLLMIFQFRFHYLLKDFRDKRKVRDMTLVLQHLFVYSLLFQKRMNNGVSQ